MKWTNLSVSRMDFAREWCISHLPVFHPQKPGKVRRVMNGAAKFQSPPLNNTLLTGPDLLQNRIHILFRFRQYPHAVFANIEGFFLQVGVITEDRLSLQFLSCEDAASEIAVYQDVRHIFASKVSPRCSNYALRRTATDNKATFPEVAGNAESNFYMNDYIESSLTVEKATRKAKDLVTLLLSGGFKLTKFV